MVDRRRRAVDLRHPARCCTARASTPTSSAASTCRSATSTGRCGTTCSAGCTTPRRRSRSRWSASTSTCPTPTSRSPRRCAPAASPTRRKVQRAVGRLRRVRDPRRGGRARSPTSTPICVPGGFGIRGIEGKLGALTYARTNRHPDARAVPRPAVHGDRVRPLRGRPRKAASTEFDPDCPEPVIATMEEQKSFVEGAGDLGGTMRLGPLPGRARAGQRRRETYGGATHRGAAPPPLRGQQRLPRPARRGRAGVLGHQPRPRPRRVRRAAARGPPVLRRDPGPPRAPLAPDPPAPPVQRPDRCRDRPPGRAALIPIDERLRGESSDALEDVATRVAGHGVHRPPPRRLGGGAARRPGAARPTATRPPRRHGAPGRGRRPGGRRPSERVIVHLAVPARGGPPVRRAARRAAATATRARTRSTSRGASCARRSSSRPRPGPTSPRPTARPGISAEVQHLYLATRTGSGRPR